ncbi:ABC transporter ATP-binding protein [Nocardioides carbamazepini]|uniref:ABC transporter ATP-binding protein n=1 Tax=Nocardioides carbamazepini TaxID=2854259 RepID=UPI00214A39B8|nr:ABC transporter ATP-binding protein [Nocardioides carbamazepini]MCR1785836.1 ABC transporter ATP-binding protein [Nocardioides carbamazepini]
MSDVTIRQLGLDYGDTTVLKDISFNVAEGEFVTLLGPSGCGKTTTLMSIAGLAEPTRGSISCGEVTLFDGAKRINRPPERRDCGVVFQSYAIWPHMSVADNVAYPLRLRRRPKAEIAAAVAQTLALVGLGELAQRYPHELSGGQQQRVAMARAVVYSPQVLLLDEPLSNLDAKLREQARVWLKDIQARLGLTTIFVTHDQDEALAMSDRIVVMKDGAIEQIGAPEEVYREPSSPFVASFLGSSNLIAGTVVGASAGRTDVRIGRDGAVVSVDGPVPAGVAEVQLMVRPEEVRLSGQARDQSAIPVRIESRMFLGAHYRYGVEHAGISFFVDSRDAITGASAYAHIPSGARVFDATPSAPSNQEPVHA